MSRDTIILVRHGRPELSRNVLLTADDYRDWWARYDESGLRAGQRPPPRITSMIAEADIVASSPLPRALETAMLARDGKAPDVILPGMVEAPLPPPGLGPLKFRPLTWGTLSRIIWMAGYSGGGETARAARTRARATAEELEMLSRDGRTALIFAHGWFNRMVGRQLKRRGWRCVDGRGDGYWSHRRWERDT